MTIESRGGIVSREKLVLEFHEAPAPLLVAATEVIVLKRFGGVGPVHPPIIRICIEYDDPRPPKGDEHSEMSLKGPRTDDWAV